MINRTATYDASSVWFGSGSTTYSNTRHRYIGIGNSAPSAELDISGSLNVSGTINISDSLYARDRWSLRKNAGISFIQENGRVGIKTTTPEHSLDVNGTIACVNVNTTNSTLRVKTNMDVSNNVTMGRQTITGESQRNKLQQYGNVAVNSVSIPNNIRASNDIPFDISFNGNIFAMKFNRNYTKLYCGGTFTECRVTNRVNPNYITVYSVQEFCEIDLSSGNVSGNADTNGEINSIIVDYNNDVYIGGNFTTLSNGSLTVNRIAKLTTSTGTWSRLGGGLNGTCFALAVDSNNNIYAGGSFTDVSGFTTADYIAQWNPTSSTWSTMGALSATCRGIAVDSNNVIYATGDFATAGGTTVTRVARWNGGTSWSAMGTGGLAGSTLIGRAIIADLCNNIYVGGDFTTSGGVTVNRIAKWTPSTSTWSALGSGLTSPCYALDIDTSNNLYVAGDFATAGGVSDTAQIARWNPNTSTWSTLGYGVPTAFLVYAVALDGSNNVFVGGDFTTVNGSLVSTGRYAYYDTTNLEWSTKVTSIKQYPSDSGNFVNRGNLVVPNSQIVVGRTLTERFDSVGLHVGGRTTVTGDIISASTPYDLLKIYALVENDSTSYGINVRNTFAYINSARKVVINATAQTNPYIPYGSTAAITERVFELPDANEIPARIYMTWFNTFVLTESGKIYSMGYNLDGQCGIYQSGGPGVMTNPITSLTRAFTRDSSGVDISNKQFRKMVVPGGSGTLVYAITTDNLMYACGFAGSGSTALVGGLSAGWSTQSFTGNRGPNPVSFGTSINFPIVVDGTVAGAYDGTISNQALCVLDVEGNVWTGGAGSNHRLGNGSTSNTNIMNKLPQLQDISAIYSGGGGMGGVLTQVANSYFLALQRNGDLYAWGQNNGNSAFDGTSSAIQMPTRINELACSNKAVSRVWTSQVELVYIQTTDGLVYVTGVNNATGVGSAIATGWRQATHFNTTTKLLINIFISGSDYSSDRASVFAITKNIYTNRYTLWAVGYNVERVLGIGTNTSVSSFTKVTIPSAIVKNIRTIQCSNAAITSAEVYTVMALNSGHILTCGNALPFLNNTTLSYLTFTPVVRSTITSEPN